MVKTTGNGELKESETPKFLIGIPLYGHWVLLFLILIQLTYKAKKSLTRPFQNAWQSHY